jgi:hypothetical protein
MIRQRLREKEYPLEFGDRTRFLARPFQFFLVIYGLTGS